jgi:polysaccharide biosynthesis/export protein ExoF
MTADIRTFYQRLDLTGEHVVEADGSINIALLGRFAIGGMTSDEARIKVIEAYRSIMGRSGEVNIKIVERKPIFVTGIVKSPGSFRYEPGMITVQAIALAGGYDRPAEAAARLFDAHRERERRTQAVNRLESLVAKRIRLVRQRDLLENPDARTSNEKTDSAGDDISVLMEGELRLLDAEMSARLGELSLNNAKLSSAKGQLNNLKKISEIVARQIGARSERMRVLQKMQGSGISTLEALWNAQKEVADLQMQEGRLTAEIGSAKTSIVQAEAEAIMIKSSRSVDIERELAAINVEISQQRTIIDASEKMISALETSASGARIGEPLQLKILRRTQARTDLLDADEATDLRPGDVVKVGVERKAELPPAASASNL